MKTVRCDPALGLDLLLGMSTGSLDGWMLDEKQNSFSLATAQERRLPCRAT